MAEPGSVKRVFLEALECPAADRAEFLDRACAGDAALRAEVEQLLAAHAGTAVLEAGTSGAPPGAALAEGVGSRIGPYRLLEQIGEGGFGVVFMAEQERPVVRRVALKVVKLGMDTRQVVARFEAERQALALMDHPNIAKVLDAGATETGRPYFVMELVRGSPITSYCDQNHLDTGERLALFIDVCNAVQHAHQKGIIHRDIKPSNILVTVADGRPLPKVIDFGIAKATDARLTEKTYFTEHRQLIGTPAYMSPEQAEIGGVDIDTRTDIYSLGVLLYELLTGTTPFSPDELLRAGYAEIQRVIREVEPQKPSTRLSSLKDSIATVAALRHSEPARLGAAVRGDLDWIVMKCLEKDRARRYEAANGLAMDLRRHLTGEPVTAAPPGAWYRFRKFARRNRRSVTAAALVAAALVLGIGGTTWGMMRADARRRDADAARLAEGVQRAAADRARGRAESVIKFVTGALQSSDPNEQGRQDMTVVDAMKQAIAGIDAGSFKDDPESEAAVCFTIARIMNGNGRTNEALPLAERALRIQERIHPGDDLSVAEALREVANILSFQGRDADAMPLYQRALEMTRRLEPGDHPAKVGAIHGAALALAGTGHLKDAEGLLQEALDMNRRLEAGDDKQTADCLNALASVKAQLGKIGEAEALYRQALAMRRRVVGENHPDVTESVSDLADVLRRQGKEEEAEPLFRQALEMYRRQFRGDHINVAIGLYNLAVTLDATGRSGEAEPLLSESLAMRRRLYGGDAPDVALCMGTLAAVRLNMGLTQGAEQLQEESLAMLRRVEPGDNADTIRSLNALGRTKLRLGNAAADESLLREAVAMARRVYHNPAPQTALVLHHHAEALAALGQNAEALVEAREAADLYADHPQWFPHEAAHTLSVLGRILLATGDAPGAVEAAHRVLSVQRPILTPGSAEMGSVLAAAGWVLERAGAPDTAREAEPVLRDCLAIRSKAYPAGHRQQWQQYDTMATLGGSLVNQAEDSAVSTDQRLAKLHEAEPLLAEACGRLCEDPNLPPAMAIGSDRRLEALNRIVKLYDQLEALEPGKQWRAKGDPWRAKLGATSSPPSPDQVR